MERRKGIIFSFPFPSLLPVAVVAIIAVSGGDSSGNNLPSFLPSFLTSRPSFLPSRWWDDIEGRKEGRKDIEGRKEGGEVRKEGRKEGY